MILHGDCDKLVSCSISEDFYDKIVEEDFKQYQTIDKFLDLYIDGEGEKFKKSKIKYAQEYVEKMTVDNMKEVLDLDNNMKNVIKEIERWNKL